MLFRSPHGRKITELNQLVHGETLVVYPYARLSSSLFLQGYRATVVIETNEYTTDYKLTGLVGHRDIPLGRVSKPRLGGYFVSSIYDNDYVRDHKIYKLNQIKENESMANKLMSALKLNKDQRKLSKAGVYDENGNLTADGQELMLNWLAKKHEAELVVLVKDFTQDKKKKNED